MKHLISKKNLAIAISTIALAVAAASSAMCFIFLFDDPLRSIFQKIKYYEYRFEKKKCAFLST